MLAMETNLVDNLKILDIVKFYNSAATISTSTSATNVQNENRNNQNAASEPTNANLNKEQEQTGNSAFVTMPNNLITGTSAPTVALGANITGITATNLLITSSGALGLSQIASLTATANSNLANGMGGKNFINASLNLN